MKLYESCIFIVCVLISVLSSDARAEINVAESIEWRTVDSQLIVVGKVIKVVGTKPKKHWEGVNWIYEDVTVDALKTLKGSIGDNELIFHWKTVTDQSASKWKESGHEMLFFLRRGGFEQEFQGKWTLRREEENQDAVDLVSGRTFHWPVVSKNQKVLKNKKEIVAAVERQLGLIQQGKSSTKSEEVEIPFNSEASKSLFSGSAVFLVVPAQDHKSDSSDWFECTDSQDCVLAPDGCGCATAINKKYSKAFVEKAKKEAVCNGIYDFENQKKHLVLQCPAGKCVVVPK